jgi:signal transduction histidine kinase
VVMGGLDFVAEEELRPDAAEAVADAQAAARRIALLLANLLDVAKLESNRFQLRRQRTSAVALVEPVIALRRRLASTREIALDSAVDPELQIEADLELVTRVLENLLDNGLRYTPAGGRLCVLSRRPASGGCELVVGNTGPPVPPEARSLIFEKYGQTTPGAGRMNLGLGLYFCRLVLEAHGGRIFVDESPELPSQFVLALP